MVQHTRTRRIAYYSINDPLDKRSWSGITYYMGQAIKKDIGEVDFLGPVHIPWVLDKAFRAVQKLSRFFFGAEWIPKYSLAKNIYAARKLEKKMKGRQYDLLLAPAAAPELAYLRTHLPIIYYGDATYKNYSEMYEKEFKNLSSFSKWEGEHLERKALKKSSLAIFSSQWAVNSAINDYGVSADKTAVIQLGANIDRKPDYDTIFIKEQNQVMTLLFLSVDWDRKGGPIAFEALKHLHKAGTPVKLIVCGCTPPASNIHPAMEVIPFLNKNKADDFHHFTQLLTNTHFLLLPTRADCTPLVNCEANAYGIPAITTNVGGITEAVKDGVNGYCLPLAADGAAYANLLADIFSDKERYHQLIISSRKRYDDELNWDAFTVHFEKALQQHHLGGF
jgi:glycosyltransferase involved in cell wall biosynthesis